MMHEYNGIFTLVYTCNDLMLEINKLALALQDVFVVMLLL